MKAVIYSWGMRKDKKKGNAVITRGILKAELEKILRFRFGRFHTIIKKEIREESHALEFRMEQRFDSIEQKIEAQNQKLDSTVDIIQKLADKVIGEHKNWVHI